MSFTELPESHGEDNIWLGKKAQKNTIRIGNIGVKKA